MKGLLLKEWYMMKKNCWPYLLITVIFLGISCVNDENMFFVFYPCLLCGMLPVSLLSLDENNGWIRYSSTLPYTKSQLVSVKYLICLFALIPILAATGILQTIKMRLNGAIPFNNLLMILLAMSIFTLISASFSLPFIFRFGLAKGRIVYFVMIGLFFAIVSLVSSLLKENVLEIQIPVHILMLGLLLASVGLYALSWRLSIAFYKKREV